MEERDILKKLILQKLVRANIWGGKHTPFDFVKNGIPGYYRNTHQGQKTIERTLKALVNDGWITLLQKKTGKGSNEHVSLNSRKVAEITEFLEKYKED